MKLRRIYLLICFAIVLMISNSCTISYKFTDSSINYNVLKTVRITHFPNQAPLVYPPLEQRFNEELKDYFTRNTKLSFVNQNADIELEGEIVGYELTPMAVQEDGLSSETRLTVTVKVRFRNNKEEGKDKDNLSFSVFKNFSSNLLLDQVQDRLIEEINKEIVQRIFNETMSDW